MPRWLRPLPLVAALALPAPGAGEPVGVPLEDRLQLFVRPRAILVIDARSGGQREVALELGERVLFQETDGRVAVALTDRRLLAVAARSAAFQEMRFGRGEQRVAGPVVGDRVALVVTNKRVVGFDGGSGNLVESRLGPREAVVDLAVADSVAVATTARRALGLSPFRGGFFEVDLRLEEGPATLRATGEIATLATAERLLTFRAASGTWEERRLGLGR